jgi:CxxC motif-containing protein (DUF1111 family)
MKTLHPESVRTAVAISLTVALLAGFRASVAHARDGMPPHGDSGTRGEDVPPTGTVGDPDEAAAGFDGQTNGFLTQEAFDAARETFEEREDASDGLGPVFNAQSCTECHQNPVTGGISQIMELRAGHRSRSERFGDRVMFEDAPGGSLINDRALHASMQECVSDKENVRTFRTSLNTLGDGFVEAISNETLIDLSKRQALQTRGRIRGEVIWVPVLEASGLLRVGRFGWKNQHASLLSFSGDAYLNEMGITNPLQPTENTSLGRPIDAFDEVEDPEDDGEDMEKFAAFMRSTKPPARDEELAATAETDAGQKTFESIGCGICHVSMMVTAPAGTSINAGMLIVPAALGNKTIHPFSDFLLHDVGTGDGIVQNGGQGTANKLRTPPLWGVRTRSRLMHDGESLTARDAILRHHGEADFVTETFRRMGARDQQNLLAFLKSL